MLHELSAFLQQDSRRLAGEPALPWPQLGKHLMIPQLSYSWDCEHFFHHFDLAWLPLWLNSWMNDHTWAALPEGFDIGGLQQKCNALPRYGHREIVAFRGRLTVDVAGIKFELATRIGDDYIDYTMDFVSFAELDAGVTEPDLDSVARAHGINPDTF